MSDILSELQSDPENKRCFDCRKNGTIWASLNHGIYLCMKCVDFHRGLGVHISFTRSTTLDTWSPQQLLFMQLGGNRKFREFLENYNLFGCSGVDTYFSKASEYYRQSLKALTKKETLPYDAPSLEEGKEYFCEPPISISSKISFEESREVEFEGIREDKTWWGEAREIMGGVVESAGSLALKAGESVNSFGIIGNIKEKAASAYEKSSSVTFSIIDTFKKSKTLKNLKEESKEIYTKARNKSFCKFTRKYSEEYENIDDFMFSHTESLCEEIEIEKSTYRGSYEPPELLTDNDEVPNYINLPNRESFLSSTRQNRESSINSVHSIFEVVVQNPEEDFDLLTGI